MSALHLAGEAKTDTAARIKWWPEDAGLVVMFVLMILAIGIPYPEFFSFGSIKTVLRQSALIGIIAFGMVFLVAMVEIDLSVGGIFATASSLVALLIKFLPRRSLDCRGDWAFGGHRSGWSKRSAHQHSEGSTHHRFARNPVGVFRPAPHSIRWQSGLRPTERPPILHVARR